MANQAEISAAAYRVAHGWQFYHGAISQKEPFILAPHYTADEMKMIKSIEASPEARDAVQHYLQLENSYQAMPKYQTPSGHSGPNPADLILEGQKVAASSLGSAIGMNLAAHAFPHDLVKQIKGGHLIGSLFDIALGGTETLGARHGNLGWHPGVHYELHGDRHGPDRPWHGREPQDMPGVGVPAPDTPAANSVGPPDHQHITDSGAGPEADGGPPHQPNPSGTLAGWQSVQISPIDLPDSWSALPLDKSGDDGWQSLPGHHGSEGLPGHDGWQTPPPTDENVGDGWSPYICEGDGDGWQATVPGTGADASNLSAPPGGDLGDGWQSVSSPPSDPADGWQSVPSGDGGDDLQSLPPGGHESDGWRYLPFGGHEDDKWQSSPDGNAHEGLPWHDGWQTPQPTDGNVGDGWSAAQGYDGWQSLPSEAGQGDGWQTPAGGDMGDGLQSLPQGGGGNDAEQSAAPVADDLADACPPPAE